MLIVAGRQGMLQKLSGIHKKTKQTGFLKAGAAIRFHPLPTHEMVELEESVFFYMAGRVPKRRPFYSFCKRYFLTMKKKKV